MLKSKLIDVDSSDEHATAGGSVKDGARSSMSHLGTGEDGVSLIEMLIAVLILSVGILALAGTAVSTQISTTDTRNRQQAVDAVSAKIEEARAESYADLAMLTSDIDVAADPYLSNDGGVPVFDHDDTGPSPAEPLVTDSGGPITPYIDTTSIRLTVRTYVTWYDPTGSGATDSKRVTAIATYVVGGETKEVRESTVVAAANRGLAAPDFEVTPAAQSTLDQAGQQVCFDQTMVNEGEQDKHSFTIQGWTDNTNWVQFTDPDGNVWEARGYVSLLQMVDATGDFRPDSQVFLPRGGTLPMTVCYEVPPGLSDGSSYTFTVEVASQLDPSVTRSFTHTIEIGAPGTGPLSGFLLHHSVAQTSARTFVMDTQPAPTASIMEDLDGDGIPGWKLPSTSTEAGNTTRWDWQYQGNGQATLDGTASLQLYSAWQGALQAASTTPKQLNYRLRLQLLDTSQGVTRTLQAKDFTYTHVSDTWQLVTIPFDFSSLTPGQRKLAKNEYVRLEIQCLPNTGSDDCHIAFDRLVGGGPTYTSAIQIPGASS